MKTGWTWPPNAHGHPTNKYKSPNSDAWVPLDSTVNTRHLRPLADVRSAFNTQWDQHNVTLLCGKNHPTLADVLEKWTGLLTVYWRHLLVRIRDLDTGPVARLKSWVVSCIPENLGCGKNQWRPRGAVHPSPLPHRQKGSWTWSAREVMRTPEGSKVTLLLRARWWCQRCPAREMCTLGCFILPSIKLQMLLLLFPCPLRLCHSQRSSLRYPVSSLPAIFLYLLSNESPLLQN